MGGRKKLRGWDGFRFNKGVPVSFCRVLTPRAWFIIFTGLLGSMFVCFCQDTQSLTAVVLFYCFLFATIWKQFRRPLTAISRLSNYFQTFNGLPFQTQMQPMIEATITIQFIHLEHSLSPQLKLPTSTYCSLADLKLLWSNSRWN